MVVLLFDRPTGQYLGKLCSCAAACCNLGVVFFVLLKHSLHVFMYILIVKFGFASLQCPEE